MAIRNSEGAVIARQGNRSRGRFHLSQLSLCVRSSRRLVTTCAHVTLWRSGFNEISMNFRRAWSSRTLVLPIIKDNLALGLPERNLCDGHSRIKPNRQRAVQLKRDVPMRPDINDVGGHMNEQAQSGNARFRMDERNVMVAADRLRAMTQYKVALDHLQSFGANRELFVRVVLAWIYHRLLIANEILSKRYVIGIRGCPCRVEWIYPDSFPLVFAKDFCSCQDHNKSRGLVLSFDGVGILKAE